MAKKKKIRVDLRKNRTKPPRPNDWTRGFQDHGYADEAPVADERVRPKGEMSRRRTITQDAAPAEGAGGDSAVEMPRADAATCLPGRVLRVHGLWSVVEGPAGRLYRCAVRGLLKSLVTDERSVVTTGDRVWFRPAVGSGQWAVGSEGQRPPVATGGRDDSSLTPDPCPLTPEGLIERVEPRRGVLTRASRRREHVLVANVDQLVIVISLFEPDLKPHLIDRYLASAQQGGLKAIVCLNKADLGDPAAFQPLVGEYSQLGVPALLTSAETGQGVGRLRELLTDKATVFSGQSGVGKSSLLNVLQPELGLRVREVSETTQKGRHTTTTAELIRLDFGGWVVDTPGVRQFQLWDMRPEEVEGFFVEFRPFVALCAFPDCTHTHEENCAVQRAVRRRQISYRRYVSYLGMYQGTMEE